MKAQSEYVHFAYTFFVRLALIRYAQSVLINEISALELRRKSTKGALLVGVPFQDGGWGVGGIFFPTATTTKKEKV